MEITKVIITKKVEEKDSLKGFAEIIFDDCFILKDLRIIQGKQRMFIAMPNKKRNNKFYDVAFPLNSECRIQIETAILKEYNKEN